jgi:hypothetical protein
MVLGDEKLPVSLTPWQRHPSNDPAGALSQLVFNPESMGKSSWSVEGSQTGEEEPSQDDRGCGLMCRCSQSKTRQRQSGIAELGASERDCCF